MDLSRKKILFTDLDLQKKSNYTRAPPRPVRPIGPTGQTGRAPVGSATAPDRSDRLAWPVRLVDANFVCQQSQSW